MITGYSTLEAKKQKYHKNPCANCLQYLYFSMLRCKKCEKVYCLDHKPDCCDDEFEIVIRDPSKERLLIIKYLESLPA